MTPAARIAAAIDILDRVRAGAPAERALTTWARGSRFAGAKDRAAVRDHVFDALRRRRSLAAMGGGEDGRGLMLGALRAAGVDPDTVFTGEAHAPAPLTPQERGPAPEPSGAASGAGAGEGAGETTLDWPPDWPLALRGDWPDPVRWDAPDWLFARFEADLGPDARPVLGVLRGRAPVFLRCNLRRADLAAAIAALARDGILAEPHPDVSTALHVTENARKIQTSAAFREGLVELQDAASQAAVLRLPLRDGQRVLDFCAGGGGKTLAMAARARLDLTAHDADPRRMADLAPRAARAGSAVATAPTAALASRGPFDLVLCDAPCSGSGTWRRAPEAKWRLTPEALAALRATQDAVLAQAAPLVAPGGTLAYATCSVLAEENRARVEAFLGTRGGGWTLAEEMRLLPSELWDGFYLACLTRAG